MENLHPAAQVAAVIVLGITVCVLLLSLFTEYFNKDK
jgi:hypothetical protein